MEKGIRWVGGQWVIDKDPGAELTYGFDLIKRGWMPADATITALVVTGVGITVAASNSNSGRVLAKITGGTVDEPASATYRFTLDNGDIDERTLHFIVKQR